jgi:transcriptional repressor NrdR
MLILALVVLFSSILFKAGAEDSLQEGLVEVMKCPYCGNSKTKVIDSRAAEEQTAIRRRRHCASCGSRFTTFERREKAGMVVVKRDGTREPYDREKVSVGFYKACSKREVPDSVTEKSVDEIEEEIMKRPEREIAASELGDMVMDRLRQIDEIAYLRFASVYKRFDDVSEFQKELGELIPGPAESTESPASGEVNERSGK